MPVRHEFDPTSACMVVVGEGTITARDIWEDANRVHNDPAYANITRVLLDFRQIDALDLRLSDALELISFIKTYREYRIEKRAAVVSRPFEFGLCRMLAAYAENRGVVLRPFHAIADARTWLEEPLEVGQAFAGYLPEGFEDTGHVPVC
jgi:hypothetical protein